MLRVAWDLGLTQVPRSKSKRNWVGAKEAFQENGCGGLDLQMASLVAEVWRGEGRQDSQLRYDQDL